MQRTVLKMMCAGIIILLVFGTPSMAMTIVKEHQSIHDNDRVMQNADDKIQEIFQKINETLIRSYVDYLSNNIGSRCTGTEGCQQAASYIHDQFEAMGLQVRYQNWSHKINKSSSDLLNAQNVEATQPGSDPSDDDAILFNAHYDTVPGTVGANDDGSGTVAVLAAASVLSQYSFKRTIKFVTFSGEEQGLFGSEAYVHELYDQQTPIMVELNADGVGRATTAETAHKIGLSATEDTRWMIDVMKNVTKTYGLNFDISTFWKVNRGLPFGFSDYFYFARYGYESISVWEADGDPNHHTPQDNISNINIGYLVNMTRHIAGTMAILADTQTAVPQVSIANPRFGKIIVNGVDRKNTQYLLSLVVGRINISADVRPGVNPIERVEFYYGHRLLFTDTEPPYTCLLNRLSVGIHKLRIVAYDTNGNSASDQVNILFVNLRTK